MNVFRIAAAQFYNYCVRLLARQFILDKNKTAHDPIWLTGQLPLYGQAFRILEILEKGMGSIEQYFEAADDRLRQADH